jgi:uncharacterized protein YndB with AHSA1/START domain
MPANKDFKRLIRGRMRKTGESYTAARAHLLAHRPTRTARPRPTAADYATLAGRSDAALKAATGCTWERWVRALDHVEAHGWTHRDIAKHVSEKYKVTSWWAQTVTVGYERIKGFRAVGQRRDGSFEASKSRTFAVPLTRLYRAFADARSRARWLPDIDLAIRTATRGKSMRLTWPDRSSVSVGFASRGRGKSQVAVQHEKLPDRAAAARLKQFWTERLDALGKELAGTVTPAHPSR